MPRYELSENEYQFRAEYRRCTRRWNSRPRGGGIGPLRVAA